MLRSRATQQSANHKQSRGMHRVLWILVFLLLFIGAVNIIVSVVLPGAIQRWLHERGLEAQISSIQISLPRLRADLQGLDVRNEYGRGFSAREATLGLSWWQLFQGKIHVKLVELEGVYMDLESEPGKRGRIWEIGGWRLGEGEKTPKDWRVDLAAAKMRDATVCYQHKPQWSTASCLEMGRLELQDLFVSGYRESDEPLRFSIGAEDFTVEQLLAWEEKPAGDHGEAAEGDMQKSGREDPYIVAVLLEAEDTGFDRPGNRLAASEIFVRKFAGCTPSRWTDVIRGLRRIEGHCASARRLNGTGSKKSPLAFVFGNEARVQWLRMDGQDIRLRHAHRRHWNWRAQTIALNRFDYRRQAKTIDWQQAGATGFDWCPNAWRAKANSREQHHYCLRAGSLTFPAPASLAWPQGFEVATRDATAAQVSLLDVAAANPATNSATMPATNPVTANNLQLGVLEYRNRQRRLNLSGLSLDSINGCIPDTLWERGDHCVRLSTLAAPEQFALQFPRGESDNGGPPPQSWAVDSGPFSLRHFELRPGAGVDGTPLVLDAMHWSEMKLSPAQGDFLLTEIGLKTLDGCLPRDMLQRAPGWLCVQVQQLQGKGSFLLEKNGALLANWGQLTLDNLRLSDRTDKSTGIRLHQLNWGHGLLRRAQGKMDAGIFSEDFFTAELPPDTLGLDGWEAGAEKGLLAGELHKKGLDKLPDFAGGSSEMEDEPGIESLTPIENSATTEMEQSSATLASVDGCLPGNWSQLIYGDQPSPRRPSCFFIRNLHQREPVRLAIQRAKFSEDRSQLKFHLAAGALSLEAVNIGTVANKELVAVENLNLPRADIRIATLPTRAQVQLPSMKLDRAHWCASESRCLNVETLRTGEQFTLAYDRNQFSADLNNLVVNRFELDGRADGSGGEKRSGISAEIQDLQSLQLQVRLPRRPGQSADWKMRNLRAAKLNVCLPASTSEKNPGSTGLPRCVQAQDLQSRGSGIGIQRVALSAGPKQPAQLQLGELAIGRIAMVQPTTSEGGPLRLNLHNIDLQAVNGCGLQDWLQSDTAARWAGCLESGRLHLSGDNLIPLGGGASQRRESVERFTLGPLQADGLKLRPQTGAAPWLQLGAMSWRSFGWSGGRKLRVADLQVRDFSGCLPDKPGQPVPSAQRYCAGFARLALPGNQILSLGDVLSASGDIELAGFYLRQGERQRVAIEQLGVSGVAFSKERLTLEGGTISGITGCLPAFKLSNKPLNPCFEVGRVSMAREHRMALGEGGGQQRRFHDLSIEGLMIRAKGFPADMPAQLLQVATVKAELLEIGGRQIRGDNLQLNNVSSCLPAGYIKGVDHCLNLEHLTTTGSYHLDSRTLDLALLDASQLTVIGDQGNRLLEIAFTQLRQLLVSRQQVQFDYLEASGAQVLRRSQRAQEFIHRQWNTEFQTLRIHQLKYAYSARELDINNIELVRPRTILARGVRGNLESIEQVIDGPDSAPSESGKRRLKRVQISEQANRFDYRIGEIYIDHGHFLWLDNSKEYNASLPIRRINLLVRNMSSYRKDPPAVVLLNGRPGGFGELQLAGQLDLLESSHWNAGLLGYVTDANLIPATPYIAALLGYKILQGQLDAEVNIQVRDNQVDALAKMGLEKIKVRRVKDSDNLPVKRSIIPLSLALALLKDGNGDVQFDMPVTGDLFDPKFKVSFIFSELLQRAILESLFAYFTPVGFYSLAKLAWARFRAVQFDPVEFVPGSTELTEVAETNLLGMVEKMRDNPQARPGVCGVSTALDLEALFPHGVEAVGSDREQRRAFYRDPPRGIREELLHLSGRRSHHVQKFLIDAGLDAEDFIQCAPDYIGTDFDAPRVELSN